jgi:hypothetical protein
MIADFSILPPDEFYINDKMIGKYPVKLIYPRISARWNDKNMIFRSSVWTPEGKLISASYKKFFNWQEQPDLYPIPDSMHGLSLIEKLDGSTLIVSQYEEETIIRTRGTVDAVAQENGFEIELLKKKYPKAFMVMEDISLIYEWVTPNNRIVIDYPGPDIYLTGIINHKDYSYVSQTDLDTYAKAIGVKRPRIFNFDTVTDMIEAVKEFKGVEGICVYFNHGQLIRKLKGIQYLTIHKFKNNLTLESMLDMYFVYKRPSYNDFVKQVTEQFDYECYVACQGDISLICDASKEVDKIISHMKGFVEPLKSISRKDAATKIMSSYGSTGRSAIVFNFLDNKEPDDKHLKKLFMQVLLK